MDLENLRLFVKVAELASFTRASEQLGMPKSRVSLGVKAIESEVGARLLHRTTRAVRLTPDGEQFFPRARQLVDEADELSTMFQSTSTLRGRIRIDLPIAFARNLVLPRLPDFLALHPHIEVVVSATDRRVDVVRDGFDCVLRIGALVDSGLVVRHLGRLAMVNCASPAYLRKFGVPRSLADLDRHQIVHYSLSLGGDEPSFEYEQEGRWVARRMKSVITVNNTDAFQASCIAGLGIIQTPRIGSQDALQRGLLIEILPDFTGEPLSVSLVHGHGRSVPKRVRALMSFLANVMQSAFIHESQ